MYGWTPDECIPAFFVDPTVFTSLHKDIGMVDISFPPWCDTAEDFITYHHSLLESDHVSRQLHLWIDLNFGYCLDGQAAVENKNVPLKVESSLLAQGLVKNPGFVQLFRDPHPEKLKTASGKDLDRPVSSLFDGGCGNDGSSSSGGGGQYYHQFFYFSEVMLVSLVLSMPCVSSAASF